MHRVGTDDDLGTVQQFGWRSTVALRGKTPTVGDKRLKCLLYGPAGCGKTTAAIQFPRPYLIDTERGAENDAYVKAITDGGGAYFQTTDADELIKEVTALLSEKHKYRTLIIDPLTVIYNDLLDISVKTIRAKGSDDPTAFGRHKTNPDMKIKHLLTLLLRLDMNVIITSHAKANWVRTKDSKGNDTAVQEGITFDCFPRLDYLFDLVLEVGKRGKERVATVRKTRLAGFPEGEVIPFNYNEIAERYGRQVLERDAVPETLASTEQVASLLALLETRTDGAKLLEKWLEKAGAEVPAEMSADTIAKCIAFLTNPAKKEAA